MPIRYWFEAGRKGKRPPGIPRCRWVDNIKLYLREIEWDVMEWINLAQDTALMNTEIKFRVPKMLGSC
jgi:hypothetical protein